MYRSPCCYVSPWKIQQKKGHRGCAKEWAHKYTCAVNRSSLYLVVKVQAFFRSATLTLVNSVKVTEVRRQQGPAAERQEMSGALGTQQRRKAFCSKVWEETRTMWGGPCVCCFLFSVKKTLKLFFLFYYRSIIELWYYISFRCTT